MTDCFKRRKVEGDKLDRLTDLPINVKHQIQEHLSIEEAARMSVLSTSWKHVWPSNPKLVFSAQFCNNKSPGTLIDLVSTILVQHVGAIKTFCLNISSIPSSQHSNVDQWMLLLSRNGVMDLTLHNRNNKTPYKLPSCVYGIELDNLDLSNCIFSPPSSFRGFHKLKSISLLLVALELDVATSCLWMPNLESLNFMSCSGVRHLKMYAPQLLELNILTTATETLKLAQFKDCRKLKCVGFSTRNNRDKAMNLMNLLSGWPAIRFLLLDSNYLKSLCSGTDAERIPTCLNSLRVLTFHLFNFGDEVQVNSLLRMLRSFPDLDAIHFSLRMKKKDDMEANVNHFERLACKGEGLNKLQQLTITNFHGSRTELLFLRFILASAPLLRKTILTVNAKSIDEDQCLKISKELMEFTPASPKLGIIFEPPTPSKLA